MFILGFYFIFGVVFRGSSLFGETREDLPFSSVPSYSIERSKFIWKTDRNSFDNTYKEYSVVMDGFFCSFDTNVTLTSFQFEIIFGA